MLQVDFSFRWFIWIAFFFGLCPSIYLACPISVVEYNALESIFNTTHGNYWTWQTTGSKWNFTTGNVSEPCNKWQGITCSYNSTIEMCSVIKVILSNYNMSGEFPSSVASLTSLIAIQFETNHLIGTIPSSIGDNLLNLETFNIATNHFTGQLPSTMLQLTALEYLLISNNNISGTLWDNIDVMKQLIHIETCHNRFTGTIPASVGSLEHLSVLSLCGNSYYGSIPTTLSQLTALTSLPLYTNLLTGVIPDLTNSAAALTSLGLMSAYFSGSLPASLGNLSLVETLNLRVNFFSGSMPSEIGGLVSVHLFELQVNLMTGNLPSNLGQMAALGNIYLSQNYFTGSISNVFNPQVQRQLSQICVDENQFTGTLPADVIGMLNLEVFIANSNCLYGTVPENVCNAVYMAEFELDAASSGIYCRDLLFPRLPASSSIYTLGRNYIHGTIPSCLYSMSYLQVLHFTGLGMTGTIPSDITLAPSFQYLSLSHNLLSGEIPSAIQQHVWTTLDLSYNRFSGELLDSFAYQRDNSSISLTVNRLSGDVPSALIAMHNVSVLNGNIFYCDIWRNQIPLNDPDFAKYPCGSQALFTNLTLLAGFVGCCGLLVITVLVIRSRSQSSPSISAEILQTWIQECYTSVTYCFSTTPEEDQHSQMIVTMLHSLRRFAMILVLFDLFVLLPIYLILRNTFTTYDVLFGWSPSSMFLSGPTAAYTLFVLWLCFALGYHLYLRRILCIASSEGTETLAITDNNSQSNSKKETIGRIEFVVICAVNLCLVGGINVAYVSISLTYKSSIVTAAQLAMAAFKLFWTACIMSILSSTDVAEDLGISSKYSMRLLSSKKNFIVATTLILINNIIIPMLSTAVVESRCFYNAFNAAPNVAMNIDSTNCILNNCTLTSCTCITEQENTSIFSFSPPYSYSYMCSSALITAYVPVFVLMFALETVLIPLKVFVLGWWRHAGGECSANVYLRDAFYRIVLDDITRAIGMDPPQLYNLQLEGDILSLTNHLVVMATFGVSYPPLALIGLSSVVVRICCCQIGLIRQRRFAIRLGLHERLLMIHLICVKTYQNIVYIILPSSMVISLYLGFSLFDILGDAIGGVQAIWILIVMAIHPLLVSRIIRYYQMIRPHSAATNSADQSDPDSRIRTQISMQVYAGKHEDGNSNKNRIETENPIL